MLQSNSASLSYFLIALIAFFVYCCICLFVVLLPCLWTRRAIHNNKSSCRSQQLLGTVYGVGFDCRTGKLQSFEGHKEGIWNKVNLTTHIKWKRREMPQPYKNIQRNNLRAVWTIFSGISSHRMDSWSNPEIS